MWGIVVQYLSEKKLYLIESESQLFNIQERALKLVCPCFSYTIDSVQIKQ